MKNNDMIDSNLDNDEGFQLPLDSKKSVSFESVFTTFIGLLKSIRSHYTKGFNRENLVNKFLGILFMYIILGLSAQGSVFYSVLALIWSILSWLFWNYALFSFQGGVIDTISSSIIHFGGLWAVIGKLVLQRFIIFTWISFIAPISGFFTWRKLVKENKHIQSNNPKSQLWD